MQLNLAIYGYDSEIGKLVTDYLDHSPIEFGTITPLSPLAGEFDAVRIKGRNWLITSIHDYECHDTDIFLALCPPDETARLSAFLGQLPCFVVDSSGHVPAGSNSRVIIPRINGDELMGEGGCRYIRVANSMTTQLALTLAPLHDEFGVRTVHASALVSVSEFGMLGTEGLAGEAIALFNGSAPDNSPFAVQQAFNLINQIGSLNGDVTVFEQEIVSQIVELYPELQGKLSLYCIQVPIFYGHCIIVNAELEEPAGSLQRIRDCLAQSSLIKMCDDQEELITPVTHLQNEDKILISRMKLLPYSPRALSFMAFMDNARVGMALSCVEIIEQLAEKIKRFA